MIDYVVSMDSILDFDAWSGARPVLDDIAEDEDAEVYINDFLEEECRAGIVLTQTQINDFLWFDACDMLVEAGIWDNE